ncbi:hypothetical protein EXIGLDRAFT_419675 [Exidia glandulosa HHB12029]|uniref:Uncharacterized protein n=1 Tax=Exidia glandulosa HHB12029 TaxID=1314781 RepID=A0A165PV32_EXIGL|nr:hypothetical protein EXIGLDRAFT_419675 [Exidia glandulosa HHB12029]
MRTPCGAIPYSAGMNLSWSLRRSGASRPKAASSDNTALARAHTRSHSRTSRSVRVTSSPTLPLRVPLHIRGLHGYVMRWAIMIVGSLSDRLQRHSEGSESTSMNVMIRSGLPCARRRASWQAGRRITVSTGPSVPPCPLLLVQKQDDKHRIPVARLADVLLSPACFGILPPNRVARFTRSRSDVANNDTFQCIMRAGLTLSTG